MITLGLVIPVGLYREVISHRQLLKSGTPTRAIVVDRWEETSYRGKYAIPSRDYYVELIYNAGDERISRTRVVDRRDYESSALSIRFAPDDPQTFVFVDKPTTMADMPLGLIIGLAFMALGMLSVGWALFPNRTTAFVDWLKNDAVLYKD